MLVYQRVVPELEVLAKKCDTFQSSNQQTYGWIRSIAFPTVTVVQNLLIFYVDIFWYGRHPGTPQNKGWCKTFSRRPMPITVHIRFTPEHSRATSCGWRRCDIAPLRWKKHAEPQQESVGRMSSHKLPAESICFSVSNPNFCLRPRFCEVLASRSRNLRQLGEVDYVSILRQKKQKPFIFTYPSPDCVHVVVFRYVGISPSVWRLNLLSVKRS